MGDGQWKRIGFRECRRCGYRFHRHENFTSDFFNPEPCAECGEYDFAEGAYTYRWCSSGTWWKPWTWRHWEDRKNEYRSRP